MWCVLHNLNFWTLIVINILIIDQLIKKIIVTLLNFIYITTSLLGKLNARNYWK